MEQNLFEQVRDYYLSCRHYADETAAYPHETWDRFVVQLYQTFEALFALDRETGEVVPRPGLTGGELRTWEARLREEEKKLIPLHDPEQDKMYLWNGTQMPWQGLNGEEWKRVSFDGPDFRPHVTMHLVRDGKRHPAVVISGGRYRENLRGGRPAAEMLSAHGYHAFVLNDRHGSGLAVRKSLIRALDLQRAVRMIRVHADELMVNPDQIVTFGMSMGNRPTIDLINSLGIETNPEEIDSQYIPDEIDGVSARINAYISEYPATFPWQAPNRYADFPPTFGVMGNRDFSLWRVMPFYNDLIVNRVAVELHIYDGISHGFGIGDMKYYREEPFVRLQKEPAAYVQSVTEWTHLLFLWLDRVLAEGYRYQWPIDHFDPGNRKESETETHAGPAGG